MSHKNKWRTRGTIQFMRKTRRLSDGGPDGDVLFIRVRGKACVFATLGPRFPDNKIELWGNDGLYFQPANAVIAGKQLLAGLRRKMERV